MTQKGELVDINSMDMNILQSYSGRSPEAKASGIRCGTGSRIIRLHSTFIRLDAELFRGRFETY